VQFAHATVSWYGSWGTSLVLKIEGPIRSEGSGVATFFVGDAGGRESCR
jgi:hypothetical protein